MKVRYGSFPGFDLSESAALKSRFLREDNAGGGGDGTQGGGSGDAGAGDAKTFTQAELDGIIADRVRREANKFSDYNDLKTKATEFDKLTASQKNDLEKAVDEATNKTRAEVTAEFQKERFADKVLVAAAKDFADPEDAVLRLRDDYKSFLDKDGAIDTAAIKTALDSLIKDKPYLKGSSADDGKKDKKSPGSVDGGARKTAEDEPSSPSERMRKAYAAGK